MIYNWFRIITVGSSGWIQLKVVRSLADGWLNYWLGGGFFSTNSSPFLMFFCSSGSPCFTAFTSVSSILPSPSTFSTPSFYTATQKALKISVLEGQLTCGSTYTPSIYSISSIMRLCHCMRIMPSVCKDAVMRRNALYRTAFSPACHQHLQTCGKLQHGSSGLLQAVALPTFFADIFVKWIKPAVRCTYGTSAYPEKQWCWEVFSIGLIRTNEATLHNTRLATECLQNGTDEAIPSICHRQRCRTLYTAVTVTDYMHRDVQSQLQTTCIGMCSHSYRLRG